MPLHGTVAVFIDVKNFAQRNRRYRQSSIARQNACVQSAWQRENLQMQNILSRLSAANPANVLKRGYAYVRSEKGRVYSASQVTEGQKLTVTFDDGSAETVVTKVNNET